MKTNNYCGVARKIITFLYSNENRGSIQIILLKGFKPYIEFLSLFLMRGFSFNSVIITQRYNLHAYIELFYFHNLLWYLIDKFKLRFPPSTRRYYIFCMRLRLRSSNETFYTKYLYCLFSEIEKQVLSLGK